VAWFAPYPLLVPPVIPDGRVARWYRFNAPGGHDTARATEGGSVNLLVAPADADAEQLTSTQLLDRGGIDFHQHLGEDRSYAAMRGTPVLVRGRTAIAFKAHIRGSEASYCHLTWTEPTDDDKVFRRYFMVSPVAWCDNGEAAAWANRLTQAR
jgi:hypothetical protein